MKQKETLMLSSDKIATAFTAIVEEAEKLIKTETTKEQMAGLKSIISIAKHQSDIRGLKSENCPSHATCKKK
jgi:hypothetical protein